MNPENFKKFIQDIRDTENMMGDGVKRCMDCEKNTKEVARKNMIYKNNIESNVFITDDDIDVIRPNIHGISPLCMYDKIVGKKLIQNVNKGEYVRLDHFENISY